MSVDQDPSTKCETESDTDSVFTKMDRDGASMRKRKVGIVSKVTKVRRKSSVTREQSRRRTSSNTSDVSEIEERKSSNRKVSPTPLPRKKSSSSSAASNRPKVSESCVMYDIKEDEEDKKLRRRVSANKNWDGVLKKSGVYHDAIEEDRETKVRKSSKGSNETDKDENADKWNKAQKIAKFVRPVYKPLNLENVSCKVPKGKSDPKDCLSKDPFYAGWAKIVGKRVKTKTLKKKNGETKTVVERMGRSMPACMLQKPLDVLTYSKTVSCQLPPHLNKRPSIDFRNQAQSLPTSAGGESNP